MKKIITTVLIYTASLSLVSADFMFEETDPYCSISGTTHNSFPGEISDTSSWYIPTAYESACDETPELTGTEKDRIFGVMIQFFESRDYMGPVYGGENGYGGSDTLNPDGQKFLNEKFFPTVISYINSERKKANPNAKNIAILNYAVKTIGYDYFLNKAD